MKRSPFKRTRRVFRWIGGTWKWAFSAVRRPFVYAFSGMWRFFVRWWTTRQAARLLGGLPALLVGVAAVGIYFAAQLKASNHRQLLDAYSTAAASAKQRGNFPQAKLYLERLVQSPSVDTAILFDYAKAAQQAEDYPRMAATMRALAPIDRAIFAPAHLWQAIQVLSSASPSSDDLAFAQTHLQHSLKLSPKDINAHRLLGEIHFSQGRWQEALPHLIAAVEHSPRHKLMLAKACGMLKDQPRMMRYAEEARQYFSEQSLIVPDDPKIRLEWAEAALLLDRFDVSAKVLQEALKLKDEPAIQRALARVFTAWFDALERTKNPDRQFQFELLATGIVTYPDEPLLFDRLLKLLLSPDTVTTGVRAFLNKNIVEGRAIGLSHLLLGAEAYEAGQTEQAKTHFERAFDALPNADLIANNLAWLLAFAEPPQLDRALELIEPVVERNPKSARFRDTRGQILLKLDRPKEALSDLEFALPTLAENGLLHNSLADCYDKLLLPDLATKHREAARKYDRLTAPITVPLQK